MSDDLAIRLTGVGKMYKLFSSRMDTFLDSVGLARPFTKPKYREFWALRGIDLELKKGQRIGIVGRNGAGKSTMLKLITGNLDPTEGKIEVNGSVQALLKTGAGFHPEFTGYENIKAALTYQGLEPAEIEEASREIAQFTELGEFLNQPFKSYSLGMQARLTFAAATVIKPEILIIDEILGAGDAYFVGKSADRIMKLINSGASVLLVSHALDQITRICNEAIWVERGKIMERGASMEVVKAYSQYMQIFENRRLKAKNWRKRTTGQVDQGDTYSDQLTFRFLVEGAPDAYCDVSEIHLWKDDEIEDTLLVGGAQDSDTAHSCYALTSEGNWSLPREVTSIPHRRVAINKKQSTAVAAGNAVFMMYCIYEASHYSLDLKLRYGKNSKVTLEVFRNNILCDRKELPAGQDEWQNQRIPVNLVTGKGEATDELEAVLPKPEKQLVRRWPGNAMLTIEDVILSGEGGKEQAVFEAGSPFTVSMTIVAHESGTYDVTPAVTFYRLDGVLVTNRVGPLTTLKLEVGEKRKFQLKFDAINMGNAHYVISPAIYRRLSWDDPDWYDLLDRSYEFAVVGNGVFENGVFNHPATWRCEEV
jgi:lipopolysaccharide transport system ATP-binding protein